MKELIEKKHMFHPDRDEKLLVAASGGKDSQVLLSIIKKLYPVGLDVEALYIELGISQENYSQDSGIVARKFCEELNIPFHQLNVKDTYGFNIDDIHQLNAEVEDRKWKFDKDPMRGECSYCGTLKRYMINKFAFENGFTCVATGHNLTDETTQLMNNFFNMDLNFLAKSGPVADVHIPKLVPRVKPLFFISEEEIAMYAYFADIAHLGTECAYSTHVPNIQLKKALKEIEDYRRGNNLSLARRYHKIMQPVIEKAVHSDKSNDKLCSVCGFPTFGKKCKFCKTIAVLTDRFQQLKIEL
ncbi:ATP-binding protein [Candidatus Lokiarchaeum ossiferum]|uniref:ATP-binding protein n=1 Tax=Candidatus Lokiarchaeum ossiferum TaxID=2951803 RepID=UPI00352E142C